MRNCDTPPSRADRLRPRGPHQVISVPESCSIWADVRSPIRDAICCTAYVGLWHRTDMSLPDVDVC